MYFVVEAAQTKDGALANLVTAKNTIREAKMLFHQVRASALANDNVIYAMCSILDENGRNVEMPESHVNPVTE